ncbi:hypothetical protein Tco_0649848 [Tanacetum coccineum]
MPKRMENPGLFTLPYRLGDSKSFDTLADLGSYVNINIGLLEESDHVFGLADGTKSYPIGMVTDKDLKNPLLVGRGFLATTNAVIDCRKAKIAVGERITRSAFGVKGIELGEDEAPYWTIVGKRESYKPRPSSDGVGARTPYYARKEFMDCYLLEEWEIARDAEINHFKDVLDKPSKNIDEAWHAKIRLIDPDGEEFTKTLQSITTSRKLSERESPREIIN